MSINDSLLIIFLIMFVAIILEWRMKYPLGATAIVLCIIPPFVKRIRIYGHKWIGFDSEWKFIFLKETGEDNNRID